MLLLGIADDLTGALEVGAFLHAPVSLRSLPANIPDRLIIDTESRHLRPAEAAARVQSAVGTLSPSILYKKTDSSLRGHIAPEMESLSHLFPERPIFYIPAYPRMGRTVENGLLLVHGVPVHESSFAADALNPVTTSRITDLVQHIPQLQIFDARTDMEVDAAVQSCLHRAPSPILCGPASVASALALHLGLSTDSPGAPARYGKVLVVNGSRHPRAGEQVLRLQPHPGWTVLQFECNRCSAQECSTRIAQATEQELARRSYDTLIVIGGDTAVGIVDRRLTSVLYPVGEVASGMPMCRMGRLQLITKAGGFGPIDLLRNLQIASEEEADQ